MSFDGKRLISVTLPDGNHFEYKYNVDGLRISKEIDEVKTTYSYEENKLILQQSSSLKLEFLYDEKDYLYGFIKNNNERYYYIRDALGNILGIINQNGQIVVQYSYTSYGVCSISGNTSLGNENPFRYKGYYYDVETSLYYLTTRYYDPEIGRFISPDSVEYLDPQSINGLNIYCYCGNDPVNRFDPSGHAWEWSSFWQGVGYLVTGIGAIVAGALVIASGVATWPMLLVAGITIGAGALTTINGASEVVEAGTGYNFVEDTVFGGNSSAYNTYATITGSVATVGSIVCGGWYRYNTPRIQAYKNVGNYNFSGTLSDSTHLARPYQHSTLLQRNIIKYGKMVKESSGIYNFTIGGTYKIGWVSYGVGNVGSHPVTWKLVLDIGKHM